MLTDLEKYLSAYRKKLDVEIPDDQKIWQGMIAKRQVNRKRGKSNHIVLIRNIAATLLLLLSIGYITRILFEQRNFNKQIELADISEIIGRKEVEYKSLVAQKISEAELTGITDNILIKELYREIEKLDIIYNQSMNDLRQIGYNEKIVNTIFDTYEKKIRLLELIILESNKPVPNENNAILF